MAPDRRMLTTALYAVVLAATMASVLGGHGAVLAAPSEKSTDQRRARVEGMSAEEKEQVERSRQRFASMSPAEQERLRRLHAELDRDPDRDALRKTMDRYFEWLKTLTPYQRAELAELPPEKRIERIGKLKHEQEREHRQPGWFGMRGGPWPFERHKGWLPEPISRADSEGLARFLGKYVDRYQPEFLNRLPEKDRQALERDMQKIDDPLRQKQFLLWQIWQRWQAEHPGETPPLELKTEELAELRKELSPGLRERLETMPEDQQRDMVARLVRFTLSSHYAPQRSGPMPPLGSEKELSDFLENKVRPDIREHLLTLPPEEMQKILWLMYWRSNLPDPPSRGPDRSRGPRPDFPYRGRPPGKDRGPDSSPEKGAPDRKQQVGVKG